MTVQLNCSPALPGGAGSPLPAGSSAPWVHPGEPVPAGRHLGTGQPLAQGKAKATPSPACPPAPGRHEGRDRRLGATDGDQGGKKKKKKTFLLAQLNSFGKDAQAVPHPTGFGAVPWHPPRAQGTPPPVGARQGAGMEASQPRITHPAPPEQGGAGANPARPWGAAQGRATGSPEKAQGQRISSAFAKGKPPLRGTLSARKSCKAVRFMVGLGWFSQNRAGVWGFKAQMPHVQQNDATASLRSDGPGCF